MQKSKSSELGFTCGQKIAANFKQSSFLAQWSELGTTYRWKALQMVFLLKVTVKRVNMYLNTVCPSHGSVKALQKGQQIFQVREVKHHRKLVGELTEPSTARCKLLFFYGLDKSKPKLKRSFQNHKYSTQDCYLHMFSIPKPMNGYSNNFRLRFSLVQLRFLTIINNINQNLTSHKINSNVYRTIRMVRWVNESYFSKEHTTKESYFIAEQAK